MRGLSPKSLLILLGLAGCLTACGDSGATPTPLFPTTPPPAQPSPAPPTETTPSPTAALPPTATRPAPDPTATAVPPEPCTNDYTFVRDVTVPDGAQFLPGQAFVKEWEVRNTGTCAWGPDYRLVLLSGSSMGAPAEIALYPALAGRAAPLEISMTAPQEPGQYTGRWQARDPEGNLFGAVVFVTIEVIPLPVTDTPLP